MRRLIMILMMVVLTMIVLAGAYEDLAVETTQMKMYKSRIEALKQQMKVETDKELKNFREVRKLLDMTDKLEVLLDQALRDRIYSEDDVKEFVFMMKGTNAELKTAITKIENEMIK